jgi:plastocyanin
MTRTLRTFAAASALAAAATLVACGGGSSKKSNSGSNTTAANDAGNAASLTISGFAFPSSTQAAAGSSLKIVNKDGTEHTMTSDTGDFDVDVPGNGATLKVPTKPGSYAFHCKIHTTMKGTLLVA